MDLNVISESDIIKIKRLSNFIGLFCLSKMHMAKIVVPSGKKCQLSMSINSKDETNLAIYVEYEFEDRLKFRDPVSITEIPAVNGVDAVMLPRPTIGGLVYPDWHVPLELSNSGKLKSIEEFDDSPYGYKGFPL